MRASEILKELLWGAPMLGLILLCGVNLSLRAGFLQLRHPVRLLRAAMEKQQEDKKTVSGFGALTTALAGSIGTGNLVGVAAALSVGGPGAVFWMWVGAVFGMMTVWAEVVLSCRFGKMGAMGYIRAAGWKKAAALYGVGCVLASLGMGNMAQANAVSDVLQQSFGLPKAAVGAVLAVLVLAVSLWNLEKTARFAQKLVPAMAAVFLCGCAVVLLRYADRVPQSMACIFRQAFMPRAALGGAGGLLTAVYTGLSRGTFTNEAGLGSAAFAFSGCAAKTARQRGRLGAMGMLQVWVDTLVLCTLTALCLLASGAYTGSGTAGTVQGMELCVQAFSGAMGASGPVVLCLCTVLFAFASMMAWCCYGRQALCALQVPALLPVYRCVFAGCTFLGCTGSLAWVLNLCDACNGLMALPNIGALLYFSPQIVQECRLYGKTLAEKTEKMVSDSE